MPKKVVVVGAGISGLAAGCYALMNGYDVTIFEKAKNAGGCCQSWKRKNFTFDPCIHWLHGSSAKSAGNRLWQELKALSGTIVVDHDELFRYRSSDGEVIFYADPARLARHLSGISPVDAERIMELKEAVEKLKKFDPALGKPGLLSVLSSFPYRKILSRFGKMTLAQFGATFKSTLIRDAIASSFDNSSISALSLLSSLAAVSSKRAGYPIGGSRLFISHIENRFAELGGKLVLGSPVEKIMVENGCAKGVVLKKGKKGVRVPADFVIGAGDLRTALYTLLEDAFTPPLAKSWFDKYLSAPIITVAIALKRDLSGVPYWIRFREPELERAAFASSSELSFQHYCFDPTMAPRGKSAVVVTLQSSYEHWKALNAGAYKKEKALVVKTVVEILERHFPKLKKDIELIEVATPLSWERYTSDFHGSVEGWLMTPQTYRRRIDNELPDLENFFLAGQWLVPGGGLAVSALTARRAVERLCKRDGKPFETKL